MKIRHPRKFAFLSAKIFQLIGATLVVLALGVGLFLFFSKPASAAWFNEAWSFRKAINIATHTAAETNVYIQLASAKSSQLDTSDSTKFQSSCQDLRFTDYSGKLLSYYIVSGCGTNNTTIHVLLPSFPAGAQTIYYYYGNPSAPKGSVNADFSTEATNYTFTTFGSEEAGPDPIVYYKFDDGQGTSAQDSTSNKNTGALGGTTVPTWQTEDQCISGKCLFFDGTTSKVTGSKVVSGIQTISFWIRPNTIASQGIINLNTNDTVNTNGSGVIAAGSGIGSPTYYINGVATATPTLTLNQWQLVIITTATGFNSTSSFTVGTDGTNYIKGFLDDVKLYGYARTTAQVREDFLAGKNAASKQGSSVIMGASREDYLSNGLVGYWKMDESSGNAADSSGNGLILTNNGTTTYVGGKFGNGTNYDGATQYLNTATAINGIKTVSFWANPAVVTANYFVNLINSSAYITVSSGTISATGFTNPAIYVNGVHTSAISAGAWSHVVITTGTGINANAFAAGLTNDGSNHFYTNGSKMDEVRIYNRALSPEEVSQLYNWAPGPVGYWRMDEGVVGNSKTIVDSSGNGNNGTTNYGANTTGMDCTKAGKYGGGCQLDGTDDYINVPNSANTDFAYNNFTAEAWVKPAALTSSTFFDIISHQSTDSTAGYQVWFYGTGLGFKFSDGTTSLSLDSGTATLNIWQHVAISFTRGGNAILYINGIPGTSQSISTVTGSTSNGLATTIGDRTDGSRYFNGQVDDVRIYNYARTQKQIVSDMNAGHPSVGSPLGSAVGYWKFDEGQGTAANNSGNGGSALNGTLSGSTKPSWSLSGKFGKALSFGGSNAYVAMPSDVSQLKITRDITLSAWINLTDTSAQRDIICKNTGTAATSAYCLYTNSSGQLVMAVTNSTGPAIVTTTETAKTLSTSTWYHVAGVLNTTLGQVSLYVNGVLVKQNTASIPATLQNPTTILDIGAENAGSNLMNGLIDEAKVYPYALTADEVKLDYNRGASEVIGAMGNNSSYQPQAANQEYCIPGDATSCAAPVGRWDFEEGSGGSVNDISGNGNTGTWHGTGAQHWAPGKVGTAGKFNGADDYVSASDPSVGANFTAEMWIKPNSNLGTTSQALFDTKPGSVGALSVHGCNSVCPGNVPGIRFDIGGSNLNSNWVQPGNWAGQWHHITLVLSNSSTTTLYIDGSQAATGTNTQNGSSNTFQIGRSNNSNYFNGLIDQVRVYNYARTPAQIAWDYNKGAPVGWWKFDECQGTVAHDSSGNNNTGTITIGTGAGNGHQDSAGTCTVSGATAWYNGATGKRNASLNFDGIDDYVSIANPTNFDFVSNDFSLSAWVYANNQGSNTGRIINKLRSSGTSSYFIGVDSSGNVRYFISNGTNSLDRTYTGKDIRSGWHLVTATFSRSGNATLYIDGISVDSGSISSVTNLLSYADMKIGGLDGTNTYSFNGKIDDVRIYNYVLTSSQVGQVYNNGALNFGPSTGSP